MRFGSEITVHCAITAMKMRVYNIYKTISEKITVGNDNVMIAKKVGKLRCGILQKNDEKLIITLENVNYVLGLWINLFSVGKL
jgi:hypothetical protein